MKAGALVEAGEALIAAGGGSHEIFGDGGGVEEEYRAVGTGYGGLLRDGAGLF